MSAEDKVRHAMEAQLLVQEGVRRPKFSGPVLPFVLFVATFCGAALGVGLPLWLSQAVIPITVFAVAWFICLKTRDEFDALLDEMAANSKTGT